MPWKDALAEEHRERRERALWRTRQQLNSPQSVEVIRGSNRFLNFCSNDYLGLANHPRLKEAAVTASKTWGAGSGASHLVCGHQASHHRLEDELADFVGAQSALLFSTGYMANLAIPQSFLSRNDLLVQDKLNHASLIDSASLCRATFKRYRHNDINHLQKTLNTEKYRRTLISVDAVFSMDGDQAPITQLSDIAEENQAVLLIDDAHGFGVLGEQGRGSYSANRLIPNGPRLMLGTLGKALGSFGAFVAGDRVYIDHLKQFARTYTYTTALPPAVAEASRTALSILQDEPWRQEQLHQNIEYFRKCVADIGLELMSSQTPIQPLVLGDEKNALAASQILENMGIWVSAIRPPTVPADTARLRITLTAEHKREHIDQLLEGLQQIGGDHGQ
jgi:8-amino-7-oxononanoate synthase